MIRQPPEQIPNDK
jgi:hypothetical protein